MDAILDHNLVAAKSAQHEREQTTAEEPHMPATANQPAIVNETILTGGTRLSFSALEQQGSEGETLFLRRLNLMGRFANFVLGRS